MEKYHIEINRKELLIFFIGGIFGVAVSHIFVLALVLGVIGGYLAYPYLKSFFGSVVRISEAFK